MLVMKRLIIVLGLIVNLHRVILPLISLHVKPLAISLYIVDHINVGAVHILKSSLLGVEANAHSLVDTNHFNSITRFHKIYQILISAQMNGLRGLAFWHGLWRLLHLHVLLIAEH